MTVDGCPAPGCPNTEPETARVPIDGGFRAAYACSDCGRAWATDYLRED